MPKDICILRRLAQKPIQDIATIIRHPLLKRRKVVLGAILLFVLHLLSSHSAYAEEVITIYNGAGTNSDQHYSDLDIYPIERGKKLTWLSEDYLNHWLSITSENGEVVANSGPIGPRQSFSIAFNETGTYKFYSTTHPEVKGTVLVTDDIVTMVADDLRNGLDVQMSWTPAIPSIGQTVYFKTIFMESEYGKNQEHVDYELSIVDSDGISVYPQLKDHVLNGIQVTRYTFDKQDAFVVNTSIRNVFFIPNPDEASFSLVVTPEFAESGVALLSVSSLSIVIARLIKLQILRVR